MTKADLLRIQDYLDHISEAIDRIQEYVADLTESEFLANRLIQDAVIRNIEIIGEAAKNILQHHTIYANQHPEVPWAVIYAMRNRVAHGYLKSILP